jgi:peptidoglycan-N-acetylglucosamine deacetylase
MLFGCFIDRRGHRHNEMKIGNSRNLKIVTTSWDDGDVRDLRLADLLQANGVGGTFYIPLQPFNGHASLSHANLRSFVEQGFEIGAHGIRHENLKLIPSDSVARIVTTSKEVLQNILGQEVSMFCYPGGRHNPWAAASLKAAGYMGARTTRMLSTDLEFTAFEMPTTVQAYPHGHFDYLKNATRARSFRRIRDYTTGLWRASDWVTLSKMMFDRVMAKGGVWHLYGHSWEIDQLSLWGDLEHVLQYVGGRPDVLYLHNSDLLRCLNGETLSRLESRVS